MVYHKMQFTGSYNGQGYQVIDESGNQVALTDLDGNIIDFKNLPYEAEFIEINAPKPAWGV